MSLEVRWIASLCVDRGLIDAASAQQLISAMPPGADALVYAQAVIDQAHITDIELMTELAAEAQRKAADQIQPPSLVQTQASSVGSSAPLDEINPAKIPDLEGDALKPYMLDILRAAERMGASDLHLSAGAPVFVRNTRKLDYLSQTPLTQNKAAALNSCLLDEHQKSLFFAHRDFDYALATDSGRRIRVNLMQHKDGVKGTYRLVPDHIPSPAELGFKNTAVIDQLLSYHNGLVLVTGPVGSGKTTTLNSFIDQLNRTREDHIITVEDPIEFLHLSQSCNVTQRQVGQHTDSFQAALRGALREDPDIIVIGELRDLDTIEMAISASETGHLVIGTMHTSDATTTLNRILDVFPAAQQPQIRAMVSQSLRGIICQRLLPDRAGGLALACEILVNTTAVSAMIRDAKTQGIPAAIDTGRREGMLSMDNAVLELWKERRISNEVAAANILNRVLRQQIPQGAQS